MAHLLTPIEPVQLGPPGGPIAVHTKLGWSLQGPTSVDQVPASNQQCLFTATVSPTSELFKNVERFWQIDTLPYTSEKQMLQTSTVRVNVEGVQRYTTPLLRRANSTTLQASVESVLSSLGGTEKRLAKDPQRAKVYCQEIYKLEKMGYIAVVPPEAATSTPESWFIPHHMVRHNNKDRIVFNCSFQHEGKSLNDLLLPGPALGPLLLGFLIRFRQYPVAVSGDIKGMFHQIRLLPADKPVLRFIWRDMKKTRCALQRHIQDTESLLLRKGYLIHPYKLLSLRAVVVMMVLVISVVIKVTENVISTKDSADINFNVTSVRQVNDFLLQRQRKRQFTFSAVIPLLIESAYRVGRINSAVLWLATCPRLVIMQFLNFVDKSRVMSAAGKKGPLLVDNHKIMLFPDLSTDLVKR
ncbi:hypothetical protein JOB18_025626 [Solea senegalensis]|uniref:Reverse transcriptase domain-containing protein n=1 Tax=Solea senegalensis TaxID=28829 RepID=A0AAV6RFJ8_SOLSE|nr:hypothetical protein JOB18_025626 [Solea senegalensis]